MKMTIIYLSKPVSVQQAIKNKNKVMDTQICSDS